MTKCSINPCAAGTVIYIYSSHETLNQINVCDYKLLLGPLNPCGTPKHHIVSLKNDPISYILQRACKFRLETVKGTAYVKMSIKEKKKYMKLYNL